MDFLHKVIFVCKKLIQEDGKVYFDNYFVRVQSISSEAIVVVKPDGELENLPTDADFYQEAEAGDYELADGSRHEDPDYIGEFIIYQNAAAYEKFKDLY
jgi:hypothetical protein